MQEIAQNFEVKKGDLLLFQFKILSIFTDYQINSLIEKIQADPRMSVMDYEIVPSTWLNDILKVQVKVLQNPFPVMILALAVIGFGGAIFMYLSLDKIYLIAREAPEVMQTAGLGLGVLGLLGVLGYKLLK